MNRPEEKVVKSLAALAGNTFFVSVLDWVRQSLEAQRDHNDVELDQTVLRQGQGRAQELKEFLELASSAPALVAGKRGGNTER